MLELKVYPYATKIPIYYFDGTLAVANGNRLWLTEQGKKIELKMNEYANLWVYKLDNNTLFEIRQQSKALVFIKHMVINLKSAELG